MEINQVYTSPSIPKKIKINRRNIKSSVFSGAIKPQIELKKSSFSFIKPVLNLPKPEFLTSVFSERSQFFNNIREKVIEKLIKTEVTNNIIRIVKENFIKVFREGVQQKFIKLLPRGKDSENLGKGGNSLDNNLFETNKILLEIQKQLALDYNSRIDERKKELQNRKRRLSRSRAEGKEKFLESGKLGEGIVKTFDKITSPVKSIFQKIIEFFKIILTGLILNNAFIWLSKPENREKLKQFFHFLADHWKEILVILGTAKLLGVILKVVGAARSLKKLIDLFRKNKPPGGGSGPGNICNQFLNCFGNPAVVTSFSQFLSSQPRIYNTIKGIAGGTVLPPIGIPGIPPVTPGVPRIPATKPSSTRTPSGNPLNPLNLTPKQNAAGWISLSAGLLALALATAGTGGTASPATLPAMGAILAPVLGIGGATSLGIGAGSALDPGHFYGGTIREPSNKKCTACSMEKSSGFSMGGKIPGFSLGGTVGKADKPGIDMIPAMTANGTSIRLDQGEEVIRASESMRWRPLLKDINDRGGKMWTAFVEAIKRQEDNNTRNVENIKDLGKILDEYDSSLKEESRRLRLKYLKSSGNSGSESGSGGSVSTPQSSTHSSPAVSATAPNQTPTASSSIRTPTPTPTASSSIRTPTPTVSSSIQTPTPTPTAPNQTPTASALSIQTPTPTAPNQTPTVTSTTTVLTETPTATAPTSPTQNKNWTVGKPIEEVQRVKERYQGFGPSMTQEQYILPTGQTFGTDKSSSEKINLKPQIVQNVKKWNVANLQNLSNESPKTTFINMPLPAKVVNNKPTGSIPGPQGNPTPIPSISSINPVFSDDISRTAIALGIVG